MVWIRLAASLTLAFLAGCGDQYAWNQKVTVQVETPDGVRTGSSVQHVSVSHQTNDTIVGLQNGHTGSTGVAAEAVVVDVRPDAGPDEPRYLFMLNRRPSGDPFYVARIAQEAIGDDLGKIEPGRRYRTIQTAKGAVHRVPRDAYPLMVTLRDMTDPTSVTRVDPDDLAATFGPGVRLAAVTLEIVDADVTRGRVIDVLGNDFFQQRGAIRQEAVANGGLLRNPYFDTFSSKLSRNDFIQGLKP